MKNVLKAIGLTSAFLLAFFGYLYLSARIAAADDSRIHIGIVDTGVKPGHEEWYCKDALPEDFTGQGVFDVDGHGTNIAGIITKNLNPARYCLVIAKFYHTHQADPTRAIVWAVAHGARYINLSFYGPDQLEGERMAIGGALKRGVRIIVAAGNDGQNLSETCDAFPACYGYSKRLPFYVVSNHTSKLSNYGGPVNATEDGMNVEGWGEVKSGSSQSAAIFTGVIARDRR